MSLTSCEDILGEWSRPTPNPVTPSGGGSSTINATGITFDQTLKVIKLGGDALTITATATPTDATLTWESSDEAVATVVNGVVTPVGNGIATITAKSGDVKATCQVFVGNEVNISSLTYEAKNYDILKGDMGDNQLTIPNDIKVVFNGVQTTKQIFCLGNATIILADGSENEVTVSTDEKAGIKIGGDGTTLTINGGTEGTGTLTAKGGSGAAGIGTNMDGTGGNIVINGGTVTATGDGGAAGIGTGYAFYSTNTCGAITINGGTVTATGGTYGAGIGTGYDNNSINECGAITINGGTVTAKGGDYGAAGIGTGLAVLAASKNKCGAITIGTDVKSVTATKGDYNLNSISIGKGDAQYGGNQTCGTITFGTAAVFDGTNWSPDPMEAGTYGGLKLVISKKNVDGDTWTLTPAE